jgi:TctA family transporter
MALSEKELTVGPYMALSEKELTVGPYMALSVGPYMTLSEKQKKIIKWKNLLKVTSSWLLIYITGFYNRGKECLLRGTNWVFKSKGYILF